MNIKGFDENNMQELRIQKYLSETGVMSRRAAESAVIAGRVVINGEKASIGQKIIPEIDEILVDGVIVSQKPKKYIYLAMYKPAGVVTTMSDEQGRLCVGDLLRDQEIFNDFGRVYPVGRLDMYSEGLLILTNDGETANKLMHPRHEISKIYHATIKGEPKRTLIKSLETPIEIDGKMTTAANVDIIEQKNGKTKLKIEIFEGRNRQIRRLCENLNLPILKLKRVGIGKLNIGNLSPGGLRHLSSSEIKYLRSI